MPLTILTRDSHPIMASISESIANSSGLFMLVDNLADEGEWGLFCLVQGRDSYDWMEVTVAPLKGAGEVLKLGVVRNE